MEPFIKNEKTVTATLKFISFLERESSSLLDLKHKVTGAEVLHTNFKLKHHILFLTANHLAPLYARMFPDTNIAKKNIKCCQTKTIFILIQVIRPLLRSEVVDYMKNNPVSLANDMSSDTGIENNE